MKTYYKLGSYFEMFAGYDHDLSRIYYDNFIEDNNVLAFGKRQTDFMVISSSVNLNTDTMFTKTKLRKMSVEEIRDLYESLDLCYYGAYNAPNKEEMMDELVNVTVAEYYEKLHDETRWYDLPYDVISHGYCQGDAIKIVFHKCRHIDKEYIDNIFWNIPITLRLEDHENGEEWYLDEYMASSYEYDREKLLEACKPSMPVEAFEFLEEKLPVELF